MNKQSVSNRVLVCFVGKKKKKKNTKKIINIKEIMLILKQEGRDKHVFHRKHEDVCSYHTYGMRNNAGVCN